MEFLDFGEWRDMYSTHPQSKLLLKQVERATHDIFYNSVTSGERDIFNLFNEYEQLEFFLEKMIKYWESMEEFEKCSRILKIGEGLKEDWPSREDISELSQEEKISNWIKTFS